MMTIRSSASSYRRGDVPHIILTWASCLAYLCRRQPRPVPRVSKSMTPTSFFVPVLQGEWQDTIYIMTQEQVKTMLRELIEKGTYFIFEVSEISSFDGSVSNREIAMVWNDSLGKILRVQLSNASMMPGEIRFFYNDGIHLPYYRSVFFKEENDDSNEYLPLPSDVLTYVKEHDILSLQGAMRDELKKKILDLFNGDNWKVMDPFVK